jgi:hypothetical protein
MLLLILAAGVTAPTLLFAQPRSEGCEVTSGADSGPGTLREKVEQFTCETVTFQPFLFQINLSMRLEIRRDVTIQGSGMATLTISYAGPAAATGGVAWIRRGRVVFRGMQITGGRTQGIWGAGLSITGELGPTHVTVDRAVVGNNTAMDAGGGGIYVSNATLDVLDSAVGGNTADSPTSNQGGGGGGIFIDDYYGNVAVTLANSTVMGNRAPRQGGGGIRVWHRAPEHTATLTLTNTTVGGPRSESDSPNPATNTASSGGGIENFHGTVTLTDSTVSANIAQIGAGIHNFGGTMTLANSSVLANSTVESNTPFAHARGGGGIFNGGTLNMTNGTTVRGNSAVSGGGGVYNIGSMTLTNSTIFDNLAEGGGGGLYNVGTATLTGSTVAANRATVGGGINNTDGVLSVTNSTITSNGARAKGGGVLNSGGTATLTAVTLVENSAGNTGGGLYASGVAGRPTTTVVGRSLVLGNTGNHNGVVVPPVPDDCRNGGVSDAPLTSLGDNVVGANTGCSANGPNDLATAAATASIYESTAALGGGLTLTHALVAGSPAIDHVPTRVCALAVDQRGVARPQGIACDAGAFETIR